MPGNRITCLAIDESGNKWIGTEEGLVKFDGTDWIIYNTSNSGIRVNYIKCIAIDEYDNVWIGMSVENQRALENDLRQVVRKHIYRKMKKYPLIVPTVFVM